MLFSKQITISIAILGVLMIGGALYFFPGTNSQKNPEETKDQTPRLLQREGEDITSGENYDRATLLSNCAKEIPTEKIDDVSFDPQKKIVRVYWSDEATSDNVSLELPYEPEADFAGCSESAKEILRRVQQAQS